MLITVSQAVMDVLLVILFIFFVYAVWAFHYEEKKKVSLGIALVITLILLYGAVLTCLHVYYLFW